MSRKERARRWRRGCFRLIALAGATLVGLGALELVVSFVAPQRMGIPGLEQRFGILVPRASIRGRDFAPGDFDVQVSNGPERFRGRAHGQKKSTRLRVAVLGDSFTYGVGAEDPETYPARLQALIEAGGTPCEVLNAGIYGSGTGQQVIWYEAWVGTFEADVVILSVYENDARDDGERKHFEVRDGLLARREGAASGEESARSITGLIPGYSTLAQRSHLLNLARRVAGALLRPKRPEKGPTPAQEPAAKAPGFELQDLEIARLKRLVEERGAKLLVVYVPSRRQVREPTPGERAFPQAVAASCARRGIPFRDLEPDLRAKRAEGGVPLYFEGDFHCTPQGYECVAAGVHEALRPLVPRSP